MTSTAQQNLIPLRTTLVWAFLVAATCATTWWLSKDSLTPTIATVTMVLIAGYKIRLVIQNFMEIRHAPFAWRLATDIWVVASTGAILAIYLL